MSTQKTQITGKNAIIKNDALQEYTISTNEKTIFELEKGKNTTTLEPGKLIPIMFKEVLAGEYIKDWSINNLTRLLTPLVPTLDRAYINIQAYFVPHTRVWKSAEEKLAGKKVESSNLPTVLFEGAYTQYSTFNRMIISRYGIPHKANDTTFNVLLPRGYRAIVNDYIINKDWGTKKIEWNDDVVSITEKSAIRGYILNSIQPISEVANSMYSIENAPTRKGYLTNIKKNIAIGDSEQINETLTQASHLDWQTRFNDLKQRQDNVNKNDWDIIAEMGGTAPVKTDRVEFLGEVDYEMNYQQITQSAPEFDGSSPLGTTGSFSFTKASGSLFSHKKFLQHGFIHILMSVNIDNYFENGTPKELLKTKVEDIYRPGLADKETQLLMSQEISNNVNASGSVAYQPAWAEYKRLPSFVSGQMQTLTLDMTTLPENETDDAYLPVSNSQWHNFKPVNTAVTVSDGTYFRDTYNVMKVFGRNNILQTPLGSITGQWAVQPLMNMSEHIVTTQLPIVKKVLSGKDIAENAR